MIRGGGAPGTPGLLDGLLDLLRDLFGASVEVQNFTLANERSAYLVLLLTLRQPALDIVVKLAGPVAQAARDFDRTERLHQIVQAHTTIPVPETIAVDVTMERWPWRFCIREQMPGQEWASVRRSLDAHLLGDAQRQLGDAVGQLHSIRFASFGEIDADGPFGAGSDWPTALLERSRRAIRPGRLRALFLAAFNRHQDLLTSVVGARLCHDDLHQHNILFRRDGERWQLAAIVDFDKAWAGHRETDLARLDLWRGMTGPQFWAGYEQHCPVDADYPRRRAFYQLLWCLEYARPTARHEADTRRICAELGLPVPADRPLFDSTGLS